MNHARLIFIKQEREFIVEKFISPREARKYLEGRTRKETKMKAKRIHRTRLTRLLQEMPIILKPDRVETMSLIYQIAYRSLWL